MLTYTISVSIRSTLLRYSLVLSEYLINHSTCPDTINTRPSRRPSVQLEMDWPDWPGVEANHQVDNLYPCHLSILSISVPHFGTDIE